MRGRGQWLVTRGAPSRVRDWGCIQNVERVAGIYSHRPKGCVEDWLGGGLMQQGVTTRLSGKN